MGRAITVWTDERKQWLKDNCENRSSKELADEFSKKFNIVISNKAIQSAVGKFKLRLNIHNQRFKKGHEPWNKGKKCPQIKNKGQFKKGTLPYNTAPIGHEKFEKGFWYVKVKQPNVYRLKHHVIYEENFGEIPKNHRVIFKDSNHNNLSPDNLLLVTLSESMLMNLNGYMSTDPKITSTAHTLVKLNLKIKEKEGKKNG